MHECSGSWNNQGPNCRRVNTIRDWLIVAVQNNKITNVQLLATNLIKLQRRSAPETSDREWSVTCKANSLGTLDRKTETREKIANEKHVGSTTVKQT